jgi:histidyl-tRNA synthetase
MGMLTSLSGFPEWLPEDQLVAEAFLSLVKEKLTLYGFTPLRTRAIEPLSTLLSKGETSKEIYVLRRLQADGDEPDKELGLHFDLTVPFARYVIENHDKLAFPLRRYQTQEAWRGERPGLGRFREFLQADFDIIGEGDLPILADAEIVQVCADILAALPLPAVQLRVNNRKILEGVYQALEVQDPAEMLRTLDKVDKIGEQGVYDYLTKAAIVPASVVDICMQVARIKASSSADLYQQFNSLGLTNDLISTGLHELGYILDAVSRGNPGSLVADLSIARGLDYYTGTVFEARFTELPRYPSILGGGRYDRLASGERADKKMPGVGASLGMARILGVLLNEGFLKASRPTTTVVMIGLISNELYQNSIEIAQIFRKRNIPCEIYLAPDRYGKQIRYAARKGIPFIWFPSETGSTIGEVKDLRTGIQIPADANQWLPAEDLGVQIVKDETAWQAILNNPVFTRH